MRVMSEVNWLWHVTDPFHFTHDTYKSYKLFNNLIFQDAIEAAKKLNENIETCWIIGGSSIYNEVLDKNLCDRIYLTVINHHFDCDTFFPVIDASKFEQVTDDALVSGDVQTEGEITYKYYVYERNE